jgi:hypothetical protein
MERDAPAGEWEDLAQPAGPALVERLLGNLEQILEPVTYDPRAYDQRVAQLPQALRDLGMSRGWTSR